MTAKFKPGDVIYIEGEWAKVASMRAATTPAPQPEREAVPEDARVGDVYARDDIALSHQVRVSHLLKNGGYAVATEKGAGCDGEYPKGAHKVMGYHLVKRGPEVKASPAPTPEAAKGACPACNGDGVAYVTGEGDQTCRECLGSGAVSPPEAAAEVTAGERCFRAYEKSVGTTPPVEWTSCSERARGHWQAAAQAVLAAQPATEAKVEREVVGWVVRVALANDDACWNETQGWVERRYATLYSSSASARDSKPMNEMCNGRVVRVTRRRGAR